MSEILQSESHGKAGARKRKKSVVKVDLTPMVDLGFLLISFFVFTTSMAHPRTLTLNMPFDSKDSLEAPVSKTLNLLLGEQDKVYIYTGDSLNNLQSLGSNVATIRAAIFKKKETLRTSYGSDSDMIVLIKPTMDATYADIINALDEMQICSIKTYMLLDASKEEVKQIKIIE